MYASGRERDREFARGYLSTLTDYQSSIAETVQSHFRPLSHTKPPYGTTEGDIGFVINKNEQSILVIIERESSFPGNERNLLKWYNTIDSGQPLLLKREETILTVSTSFIIVSQCFCTPKGSMEEEFLKTHAYCKVLADLIVDHFLRCNRTISLDIQKQDDPVKSWYCCGEYFGKKFIEKYLLSHRSIYI